MIRSGAKATNRGVAYLRPERSSILRARTARGSLVSFTHAVAAGRPHMTGSSQLEDGLFALIPLCRFRALHWCGGRLQPAIDYEPFAASFHDMREKWRAEFTDGFDLWHLHVPRAALEEIIGRSNVEWALPPAMAAPDPVLASLIDALRPTPIGGSSSPLFVDQMLAAIVTHLASRYFQIGEAAAPRAGLGPDQEKLAKDMLEAVGRSGNRLADVASACGLSIGQFARRFRATTGLPPHRWLTSMRVARARDLLAHSNLTLAEIAMRCGFADQSHLIRVFRTAMGSSPGRWRREMIGSTLDTDDDGSL